MSGDNPRKMFTAAKINSLTLRNRVIRSAAFEGMCPGGRPSDSLKSYHAKVAEGGVAMTTVAYASISPHGRTYGHQMVMNPELQPALRELTDRVHKEGAAAAIQLGHCGSFASPAVTGAKPIGPSVVFNIYGLSFPRAMGEQDMETVRQDFVRASLLAKEAGFDAIELQAGHGYLLSQFLSPHTNRRKDRWGGSLENRMRFPLTVIRRVREALGPDYPLLAKMNLSDGFPGGQDVEEAVEVAKGLEAEGVDALVLSGGFVSKTPMYIMRGDVPFKEMYQGQESLTKRMGLLLMGRILVKSYPFKEAYFLEEARFVREAVRLPLVLVGGHRSIAGMENVITEGFEFLAMARPLILEPDLIRRMERCETEASRCEPCNKCIANMDKGEMSCPLLEEQK